MSKIKIFLFSLLALAFLVIITIILLAAIVSYPVIVVLLIIKRIRLKAIWSDFKQMVFALVTFSNYLLAQLIRILRNLKRIIIVGGFPKGKRRLLIVSNHPSWFDQMALFQIQLMSSSEWLKGHDSVPYIGAAEDSIKRLPILKIFETFYFILPITRHVTKGELDKAEAEEEALKNILMDGYSLIISGPSGRDSKAKKEERIYGPVKGKQLRKFGGLCGRLAVLPGITTVPVFIEGIENISSAKGEEIKFSPKNLLIDFLMLGKFQIAIVFGEPLTLGGQTPEEARKLIEERVLNLSDSC